MRYGLFKNVTQKLFVYESYIFDMNKQELALNNHQELICQNLIQSTNLF